MIIKVQVKDKAHFLKYYISFVLKIGMIFYNYKWNHTQENPVNTIYLRVFFFYKFQHSNILKTPIIIQYWYIYIILQKLAYFNYLSLVPFAKIFVINEFFETIGNELCSVTQLMVVGSNNHEEKDKLIW